MWGRPRQRKAAEGHRKAFLNGCGKGPAKLLSITPCQRQIFTATANRHAK